MDHDAQTSDAKSPLLNPAAGARTRQPRPIVAVVVAIVLLVIAVTVAVIFRGSIAPVADFGTREWESMQFFDWDPFDREPASVSVPSTR